MKRKWDNHELIEHWTLEDEDRRLIRPKRGINRLGFALLLKFFQLFVTTCMMGGSGRRFRRA